MATKKCKHCQTEIDAKAKVCPNCRGKLGMSTATGCLAFVLAGIVGGMYLCTSVATDLADTVAEAEEAERLRLESLTPEQRATEEKRKAAQKEMDEGMLQAQIQCPRAIKASLKAPSTAKMPHISRSSQRSGSFVATASEDASVVRVMTYVDSQNSFGTMIRTKFQCDLRKIGKEWTIIKLETFD